MCTEGTVVLEIVTPMLVLARHGKRVTGQPVTLQLGAVTAGGALDQSLGHLYRGGSDNPASGAGLSYKQQTKRGEGTVPCQYC